MSTFYRNTDKKQTWSEIIIKYGKNNEHYEVRKII